jgi:hypothetical protein
MIRLFLITLVRSLLAFVGASAKPTRRPHGPMEQREHLDLVGTYRLQYRDKTGTVVGALKISAQVGNQFRIGIAKPSGNPAVDWTGNGIINGNQGHYDWVFPDGKIGRTTFIVDQIGNIHGKVRGSGIDRDYLAIRVADQAR